MYNQKLLRTLEDRFDKLQAYLFRSFDSSEDLYSFIAHIMYNKDYADCCEFHTDGTPNPKGKELRNRAKQFLIPVVIECGGISEEESEDNKYIKNMPQGNIPVMDYPQVDGVTPTVIHPNEGELNNG